MASLRKFYKNKKILITGHTGFKGSWLAFVLHQFGAKVYGYGLKPNKVMSNFKVLNLSKNSYKNPLFTIQTNVNGTLNILNSALKQKNLGAVLIITSDKSYKNKEKITGYKETDELGGIDPYSASKASAEIVTHAFIKSYFIKNKKIGVATARAGNVIGGGDWSDDRIIPDFIKSIRNNKKFYLRFPNAVRPWQHVFDVIYGYLLLGKKMFRNQNYNGSWNFGPSKKNLLTVRQLINFIKKEINFDKKIIIKKQKDFHETKLLVLDSAKSKKKLLWKSRYSIKKSLIVTSEWYKSYLNNFNLEKISFKQFKAFFKND